MNIKIDKLIELQENMNDTDFAKLLNISRSQLWRYKTGKSKVGEVFICKFKQAFPDKQIEIFFDMSVT